MSSAVEPTKAGEKPTSYYVPAASPWPFVGSLILFVLVIGLANVIQSNSLSGIAPNEGTLNFLLPVGVLGVFGLMFFGFETPL